MFAVESYYVPFNMSATFIRLADDVVLYYSYRTPVALKLGSDLFVSPNVFSKTTGRQIKLIRDLNANCKITETESREEFEKLLAALGETISQATK